MVLSLCIRPGCSPWGPWCIYWCCWHQYLCIEETNFWTIPWWSWSCPDIIMSGRYTRQILTKGSRCLNFWCENPMRSSQKESAADLRNLIVIWDDTHTFLTVCSLMSLAMSKFLWSRRTRYVPGIVVCMSVTGSPFRYWYRSSLPLILGIPYVLGGFDRCNVRVSVVFCRIWCCPSEGCMFI